MNSHETLAYPRCGGCGQPSDFQMEPTNEYFCGTCMCEMYRRIGWARGLRWGRNIYLLVGALGTYGVLKFWQWLFPAVAVLVP
jgi:hypothetical protein